MISRCCFCACACHGGRSISRRDLLLMQGTAAVALAGMYGAMRVLGKPYSAIKEQTFGERQ